MTRPEWDQPTPNAGCQQGHALIEFYSTTEAKDCPLCAAKKELEYEITARVVAEANENAAHNQRVEVFAKVRELEDAIHEIHVIAAQYEEPEIQAICRNKGSKIDF